MLHGFGSNARLRLKIVSYLGKHANNLTYLREDKWRY